MWSLDNIIDDNLAERVGAHSMKLDSLQHPWYFGWKKSGMTFSGPLFSEHQLFFLFLVLDDTVDCVNSIATQMSFWHGYSECSCNHICYKMLEWLVRLAPKRLKSSSLQSIFYCCLLHFWTSFFGFCNIASFNPILKHSFSIFLSGLCPKITSVSFYAQRSKSF